MVVYIRHQHRDIPGTDQYRAGYLVYTNVASPEVAVAVARATHAFLGEMSVLCWDSREGAKPLPLTDEDIYWIALWHGLRKGKQYGGRMCPRNGEKWTHAEEKHLVLLAEEAFARYPGATFYSVRDSAGPALDVAKALGRTWCSVVARYQMLVQCRRRRELDESAALRESSC